MISRRCIEEQHMVARYLADQLSQQEREEFEAYYEQHPEVLADMQAVASAKIGLALLQRSGQLVAPKPRWPLQVAMTIALLTMMVGIGYLVLDGKQAPELLAHSPEVLAERLGAGLPAVVHDIESMRSEVDATIVLPVDRRVLALHLPAETTSPSGQYTVDLFVADTSGSSTAQQGRRRVATLRAVRSSKAALVVLYVDSGGLAAGQYVLSLHEGSGSSPAVEFMVQVVAP